MALTPRVNLLRDGHEQCAQHVHRVIGNVFGFQSVCVDPTGGIRVVSDWDAKARGRARPDGEIVGRYNRTATRQDIEDDLIAHLRGMSQDSTPPRVAVGR